MTRRIATACLFTLTACGGGPAPAPETAAHPPAARESTTAEPPSAAPAPVATAAPAPKSPFTVIGELKGDVSLYGVGERGFVASPEGIVFSLVGDDVVHDPLLQRGFSEEPMFALTGIGGVWPDGAWLSTTHPSGRSGFTKLWTWNGKRWTSKQSTSESRFIAGIRPWTGGRMLAVEQAGMMFDAAFRVVSGDKNVAVPAFTKRPKPQSFCYTEMQVQAFETLPTGEIFVAGMQCNDEEVTGLAVERWAPGAKKGTLEPLPGTSVTGLSNGFTASAAVTGMAVRSATDVVVSAEKLTEQRDWKQREVRTLMAHFDGSNWQEKSSPVPGFVKSLAAASDGALFLTNDRGELYSGKALDALEIVPLPAELSGLPEKPYAVSIWSPGPGDVWALVQMLRKSEKGPSDSRYFLLHTRPATSKLPTVEEFQKVERAYRLPGPPVDWCTTPFVLLYTLGRKAPANYDYPSTRVALRGHAEFGVRGVEFLEFERMGTRYFGARVPDFTLGKKLATLVEKKVPGSTPELVCHDPPTLRTLAIDLTPAAKK